MAKDAALKAEWQHELDEASPIIYGLDDSLRLVYSNRAWDRFARENAGAHLCGANAFGIDVLSITPTPLKSFYERFFTSVLETGQPVECQYDCSSDREYRRFHMRVTRRGSGAGQTLIVTNSLVIETELPSAHSASDFRSLNKPNGFISMCCHCRRTNLPDDEAEWVFIPELIRQMPLNVSHDICPVCFQLHYVPG